jgi:2-iminobutanoate/2-iminopropanoate deaminase
VREIAHLADPASPSSALPLSPATVVGDLVFCAGQVGFRPGTAELVDGGIEAQTRQVMENLGRVLESAGTSLDRIVKTLVFLGDPGDFAAFNRVYQQFFENGRFPARSTVQTGFVVPGMLVEIECVAVRAAVDE